MQMFDVVILGGGMVGLALARSLADAPIEIALVEPTLPTPLAQERDFSLRVSAISPANQDFLNQLGAWPFIEQQRLQPYQRMHVWEKDSFAHIDFSAQQVLRSELGYIIENDVVRDALWQVVSQQPNVKIINESCSQIERNAQGAWLHFVQYGMVSAPFVVGADGAHSWLRGQCAVPLTFWDYQHQAIVATIRCELPHQGCARQIFTPQGPLAFLPLADPTLCSIVWSVPPLRARALMALAPKAFAKELMVAFDHQLGGCQLESERQDFPLRMRYARQFAGDRFALIGDAAHTIHPLAGQGVNLGLADAKALGETLIARINEQGDLGDYRALRAWERSRKADAALMIASMEFFKQLFQGAHPAKKWLRGLGMNLTHQIPMIKYQWLKRAIDFS